jgi:lysozyme
MSYDKIATMIKRHEGYRERIYKDSLGNLTVGWGSFLYEGKKVPSTVCERLFYADYMEAYQGYMSLGLDLDYARKAVCVDMIFNLGLDGFKKFKKTIAYIRAGEYEKAAANMLKSKWAKQVKSRATELADMMRTGVMPDWVN